MGQVEYVVLPPMGQSKQYLPRDTLPSIRFLYPEIEAKRNHSRTSSMPSVLPSQENRLSMAILLDAIDLEHQMHSFYKAECVKSVIRDHMSYRRSAGKPSFKVPSCLLHHSLRRRSKSAPGAPLTYYYTTSTRWSVPGFGSNGNIPTAGVAQSIVQKHIECAKKRG